MNPFPVIAWWPFASGWMLLWGISASIPIIIHLWNKRKYRETTWAAMEYLIAAMKKNARRIRIEQLILLIIRTSILLLLAIALAEPLLSLLPSMGGRLGGGQSHVVLVFDVSYSMAYRDGERSRFERAKQLAAQFVDESAQGDGFTLVLMGDPPRTIIGDPAFDPQDVSEEIANLRVHHTGASLDATLAEVASVVDRAREKHSRLTHTRICFFTDLGATTWNAVSGDAVRSRIARLAEKSSLYLFAVAQQGERNVAVSRLEAEESLVTIGHNVRFQATLTNLTGQRESDVKLSFFVDDQPISQQPIEVPGGETVTASFVHRFDSPGDRRVEARLTGDPLEVDNRRFLSVPVREAIRVLCIRGRPDAARHVALALAPEESPQPRIRPEVHAESALAELDLNRYDCVFLCNVGRFDQDDGRALRKYLAGGGGLVVLLGNEVQIDSYNEHLGAGPARVLPAELVEVMPDGQYLFDPGDYRHPIVEPFRDHERAGLITTPVWKYVRLKPYDADAARVALRFDNGDPAILEQTVERGRVVLFASSVQPSVQDSSDSRWSELATWPSFPPLIQEMLNVAISGRTRMRNHLVGQPIQGVLHDTVADVKLSISTPDRQRVRVRTTTDGDDSRWAFAETWFSGFYDAEFGPHRSTHELFAMNVNTAESNLERLPAAELPSQFQREPDSEDAPAPSLPPTQADHYYRWFLGAVLMLLLVETVLAWRFGDGSIAQRAAR